MVKLLVFAILLASSPVTALLEALYQAENQCFAACDKDLKGRREHLDACKKGCNFKLHNEDCKKKCKESLPGVFLEICQFGCALNTWKNQKEPIVAIDPIPENKELATTAIPAEPERPHSIILIRLRQRPMHELPIMPMPPGNDFFNSDPIEMFNNIIKQFQERANRFEEAIRKSFNENSKDASQFPSIDTLSELRNSIPVIRIPIEGAADSSSEEAHDRRPLFREFHNGFIHHRPMEPRHNRFEQFVNDVRSEWNDLVRKQPKIPIWICLAVFIVASAILWYMVMSLCHHTPSRSSLSVRAQELVFHPYDYEGYEKEKIQPDDQPYEVTESVPIKVKLSNI